MTPATSPLPAEIGRYRVLRQIGQGAMGRVLLAHDPVLDRSVAIKLLRWDLPLPEEQRRALVERMRQEARASARVSHPNIVALFDMGEDPALGLYLVFEHVQGSTLAARLERGPLGPAAVATLAEELGSALATAHASGVLHRDIKPENVLLARHGAKVADFGVARLPDSTLTRAGSVLGTPAYSAPEALSSGEFSPESDQFSLAATLYEALSGRRAFPGDDAVAVASKVATEEPPPIAAFCAVDPHTDRVLARALAKTAQARFDTCERFGRALAEALRRSSRAAQPTLPDALHAAGDSGGPRRSSVGSALLGAALGAALVLTALRLAGTLAPPPPAPALAPAPTALPAVVTSAKATPPSGTEARPARHKDALADSTRRPSDPRQAGDDEPDAGRRESAASDAGSPESPRRAHDAAGP